MLCPLCAKENKDDAKFCGNCGGTLSAGSGDVLEDVLGLSIPKSSPPGEVGSVGLDDLFNSFSKQKPPPPPQQEARPAPPEALAKPRGHKLTMDDIINSVDQNASVNPPVSLEEHRQRTGETGANPNPVGTPAPMPRGEAEQEEAPQRKRGFEAPKAAVPTILTPTAIPLERSPVPRGLIIAADLLLFCCLVELCRHLAFQAVVQVGMAASAFLLALGLAATASKSFGAEHVGKVLLLDLAFLTIWAYQNSAKLTQKAVFAGFEAAYVLCGTLVLVYLFAGASLALREGFWKGARYAFGLLGLLSCATLVDCLAAGKGFDSLLAGEGLVSKLPAGIPYLEPCWVGMNGLLLIALIVSFADACKHLRAGRTYRALSLVLTSAILFDTSRFGVLALEAHGKPGLRSALVRGGAQLRDWAKPHGVNLPDLLPPAP